ncbi:MAG TPA: YCF48-related protein, partial [Candidatus Kapabacteria bacterium]|nr:YCF48-related protein [Candidatus Kapabacteria bacterium]
GENAHTVAMMLTSRNAITFGNLAASSANAFRTTNGGTAWSSVTVPPGNYTRIYDIDANTVMACGQSGLVAISTNGGAQWSNATITPDQPNLGGIYFSDKNHGFACGGAGALYSTSNGGSTWTQNTNISTAADLNDIAFNSASSGWAVSDSAGVVFHSNDGGNNWTPMSINASAHDTLTRVVFADANNGWIAGSYGQLYQTTNGGTTWVSINTGTSNKISDLSYTPRTNPTTIWLAGGEGMVMKSPPNPVGVKEINITPHGFALGQNYPNPFSIAGSSTSIPFSVMAEATVRLDVYNVLGECVRTLVNESKAPGSYIVSWDGHNTSGEAVPNGVYFFRLGNGTNQLVRSAIVTK